ncbi:MAG: glucosyl-3-phosphoglycerate synthase [Chloroflexi bacterium]|nr:glucosyl-3-phosphoglycerate synthase [Chloroflexota bacterium]
MTSFRNVLVPVADPALAPELVKLARAALLGGDGKIILLAIVAVPEKKSLSKGARQAQQHRLRLSALPGLHPGSNVEIQSVVRVAHEVPQGIIEAVDEQEADLLILGWKGFTTTPQKVYGATIDEIIKNPPCDVVVVRPAGLDRCRRILLPVRGGQYAELALCVANGLACDLGASITVMHSVVEEEGRRLHDAPYAAFQQSLEGLATVTRLVTIAADAETAILQEAADHDLVVMGATARPGDDLPSLGPIAENVARQLDKCVMIVKTREPVDLDIYMRRAARRTKVVWPGRTLPITTDAAQPAVLGGQSLSRTVDKWFAENTFHSREFKNIARLVELKRKQGLTISLGLPTLNEEKTIGNIIRTIKRHLVDKHPLLDEMVVIDSGSTDATVEIAAQEGIPAFQHRAILPGMGSYKGKGEALWKSLHVLKGDLIAWIDTDIRNIHPAFVYGVVGPLLLEPQIAYVKGFYRRPLVLSDQVTATGGGRVTELTARPLFNLFFPELSGIIQPLAGEYAGRREVLEQLPFFTGYGVETGLLVDLCTGFGLHAIAQVDLLNRVHRNQTLMALSTMAFAIVQVFMRRVEDRHKLNILEEVNTSMKLIREVRRGYYLDLKEIREHERPPIATVTEYRAKRGK